jgi:quinol monooxygenase YgiN
MIVEYIRYKIESEQHKEFEDAYDKAGKSLRASPHCIQYELSNCIEEPKRYILRIEWDSQDGHLKGFRTGPEFQTFFEAVRPFYNNIEEMHHYNVIHAMGREENRSNTAKK